LTKHIRISWLPTNLKLDSFVIAKVVIAIHPNADHHVSPRVASRLTNGTISGEQIIFILDKAA